MTSEATAVPIVRADGRAPDQLRPISITRGWSSQAEGSALIEFGNTRVLCTASLTAGVPRWLKGEGRGWVTAEYAMLPRATNTRSDRESVKGKIGGRTHEISRLIGRSLRSIIDTIAAVSVGIIDGVPMLDLPYVEDVRAETDMNVVVTGSGKFVEVQGTAEGAPFDRAELDQLLDLALLGTTQLAAIQRETLADTL